ncbi:MAG: DUF547 domain-containing protein [Pseudomonadota bacterium]
MTGLRLHGRFRRGVFAVATTVMVMLRGMGVSLADTGPRPDLWEVWTAHAPNSTEIVDHSAFDTFLGRYLVMGESGVALVRYGSVSATDKDALTAYVNQLAATSVSALNRDEQMAYWINLYNAATVMLILEHYPTDSILDLPVGGWFSFGPWGEKILEIEGRDVSLNDIEHRILRPIWKDARIHYAVNCASIGCPNLAPQAFTAENKDRLMDAGAKAYVNHPRGARLVGNKLVVSSIYSWFESDFTSEDGSVVAHLLKYATPQKADELSTVTGVFADDYSWALNGAP